VTKVPENDLIKVFAVSEEPKKPIDDSLIAACIRMNVQPSTVVNNPLPLEPIVNKPIKVDKMVTKRVKREEDLRKEFTAR